MVDSHSELYTVPLDEFTVARNELAKKLRGEGETEEADRIAKLRKPSVAAWALNRVAKNQPDEIEKLIEVHQRIREAKSSDDLRQASQQRNDQVARLTDLALEELEAGGHSPSAQSRDRVFRTLLAVASNRPEAETELRDGRLVSEIEPSGEGWNSFGLPTPPAPDPKQEARRAAEEARTRAEKLEAEAVLAEQRLEAAKNALTEARRHAKQARTAAERAVEEARAAEQSSKA